MVKIQREQLPPHVVFVDTSILFHNDKKFPVNPKFDEFWNNYSSKFCLKLKIPEVVNISVSDTDHVSISESIIIEITREDGTKEIRKHKEAPPKPNPIESSAEREVKNSLHSLRLGWP